MHYENHVQQILCDQQKELNDYFESPAVSLGKNPFLQNIQENIQQLKDNSQITVKNQMIQQEKVSTNQINSQIDLFIFIQQKVFSKQTKRHQKKKLQPVKQHKIEKDQSYQPNKRKRQQKGKNFLANFTKPFLNLLSQSVARSQIHSPVFNKYQGQQSLNLNKLMELLRDEPLTLPILQIFMRNLKHECQLSKIKKKKVLIQHFKQLRKLKKRIINLYSQKEQNNLSRYSIQQDGIQPWLKTDGSVNKFI